MNKDDLAGELTMQEVLASIRRILADAQSQNFEVSPPPPLSFLSAEDPEFLLPSMFAGHQRRGLPRYTDAFDPRELAAYVVLSATRTEDPYGRLETMPFGPATEVLKSDGGDPAAADDQVLSFETERSSEQGAAVPREMAQCLDTRVARMGGKTHTTEKASARISESDGAALPSFPQLTTNVAAIDPHLADQLWPLIRQWLEDNMRTMLVESLQVDAARDR